MITKWAAESRLVEVDFSRKLASAESFPDLSISTTRHSELLTSATARELTTADLTLSTPSVNTTVRTIEGKDAAIGKAVSLIVDGGVAGTEYGLHVEAITDAGQTLIRLVTVRVI